MHRAVRTRCAAAVKLLLKAGADPRLRNKPGSTPFHLAAQDTGRGGSGTAQAKAAQRRITVTCCGRDNAGIPVHHPPPLIQLLRYGRFASSPTSNSAVESQRPVSSSYAGGATIRTRSATGLTGRGESGMLLITSRRGCQVVAEVSRYHRPDLAHGVRVGHVGVRAVDGVRL